MKKSWTLGLLSVVLASGLAACSTEGGGTTNPTSGQPQEGVNITPPAQGDTGSEQPAAGGESSDSGSTDVSGTDDSGASGTGSSTDSGTSGASNSSTDPNSSTTTQ